jgi:DNA polymerase-3 subunit delta'
MAKRSAGSSKAAAKPRAPRQVEFKPDRKGPAIAAPGAPLRLGGVIGQARAIAALRAAIQSGRIHHAWIFDGPQGTGKFTTALAFAAMILDPTLAPDLSGQPEPDPDSPTQRLIAAGTHPDLHIVTKELAAVSREAKTRDSKQRNIAKEVLQEFLIEPAVRTPSVPAGALASKVFIVDEAELIEAPGQNALLKTLEEPAPGSVIILVTASEERLLPTIRSRCQRVAFVPLGAEEMTRWLRAGTLDLSGLDAAAGDWLLAFAGGSPGAAKLAVGTGLVEWHKTLAPMLAEVDRGRYPVEMGATMARLVDDWAAAWVEGPGGKNASKDAANKMAARQMFRLVTEHYRSRLRHAAARGEDEAPLRRALAAIDLAGEAERQAEASVNAVFVMDNLVAQLAGLSAQAAA